MNTTETKSTPTLLQRYAGVEPKKTTSCFLKEPKVRMGLSFTFFVVLTIGSLSAVPAALGFFKVMEFSNTWIYALGITSVTCGAADSVVFVWLVTEGYLYCKKPLLTSYYYNQEEDIWIAGLPDKNAKIETLSDYIEKNLCSELSIDIPHNRIFHPDQVVEKIGQNLFKNKKNAFAIVYVTFTRKSQPSERDDPIYCVVVTGERKEETIIALHSGSSHILKDNDFESAKQWLQESSAKGLLQEKKPFISN